MKALTAPMISKEKVHKNLSVSLGLHDGLRMYYTAIINGKKVGTWRSDSFVQYFPHLLDFHIRGYTGQQTATLSGRQATGNVINVVESGNDLRLSLTFNETYQNNDQAMIWLKVPSLPHLNGLYWHNSSAETGQEGQYRHVTGSGVSGITIDLYNKNLNGLTFDGDGSNELFFCHANFHSATNTFRDARIIVGSGNTPVNMWDILLDERILNNVSEGLVYGSMTHDPTQVIQENSSYRLKRTFTNQTAVDVHVREFGIAAGPRADGDNGPLIIRDVPGSDLIIPPNGSLEIIYDIRSIIENISLNTDLNGTNKGLLTPFISNFRSSAINTSQTISSYAFRYNLFRGSNTGNHTPYYHDSNKEIGYGIVLGTDNNYVSQTDTSLFNQIMDGIGDGKMSYSGSYIKPFIIDTIGSKFAIRIGRLFTNYGSTPIVVGEMGLFLGTTATGRGLFARAAFAEVDQVTINPGETVRAELTLNFPV